MTTRRSGSRSRRSALHIDHRATKGSRFSGAISSQRAPHSPSDWQTLKRSCPADVSVWWCPRPSGLRADTTMPTRASCSSRCDSRVGESPGAPARISLKLAQPRYRLRMMSGVQRSAKISAPRAIGQYWPYVLMTPILVTSPLVVKSRFLTIRPGPRWSEMASRGDTMTTPTTAEFDQRSKGPTVVGIDGFRGRLIRADHPDYDIARAVWNGAIDRRPRLIARCIGTADVVAAVRLARDRDLEIAIRGGGHNVAGTAAAAAGAVIIPSAARSVSIQSP